MYSDGFFGANNDSSFQVGYLIILADKYNKANLIDYASIKSRRFVRYVLGAESFALANASDAAELLQHDLKNMLNKTLQITILNESPTLFTFLIKNATTTEKRRMIDIKAFIQAYNDEIINDIIWMRRNFNLADVRTEIATKHELIQALDRESLHYEIQNSIIKPHADTISSHTTQQEKDELNIRRRQFDIAFDLYMFSNNFMTDTP